MNPLTPQDAPTPAPGVYVPGYARAKLGMIAAGLLLMGLGFSQFAEPLRLLLFGERARAEAVRVVKTKEGLPDQVLESDRQVTAALEPRDRSYTFWNEFRFADGQGSSFEVRAPVGSQLKPLYPLIDEEGLPTTDLVVYDRAHPERSAFPMIVSTWFAPGMLFVIGTLCAFIGSFLFYWAKKPIELPRLPPTAPATSTEKD
ncbi:DUF3592 domain-containing protein [Verrucomicrobium sp. GAS474]|uniref:DUF3592 domain-containing protein n=1 Tax=Verrucomicrobium sp. GAS474 TaxID=1882831 RepID=UPI0012FF68DE|nr:DUF3592 domain-containing protein [Verrucomicrobium sp. GAS474]